MKLSLEDFKALEHKSITLLGMSGVGKTRLIEHALGLWVAQGPKRVVLSSRCHPFESVPFKALDGVIDDRTMAAIGLYATEYGYSGPKEITTGLLQHLEDEADAMGVLDLIQ